MLIYRTSILGKEDRSGNGCNTVAAYLTKLLAPVDAGDTVTVKIANHEVGNDERSFVTRVIFLSFETF